MAAAINGGGRDGEKERGGEGETERGGEGRENENDYEERERLGD